MHKECLNSHISYKNLMVLRIKWILRPQKLILRDRKRKKDQNMRKRPKNRSTDNFGSEGTRTIILWVNKS
jgi:hypothetical protein